MTCSRICKKLHLSKAGVVGWTSSPVAMGVYNDYNMTTPGSNKIVAGICHARGGNAHLPARWLIYITVADVEKSTTACEAKGRKVLARPGSMGSYGKFCVIQDPAGAAAALFEPVLK